MFCSGLLCGYSSYLEYQNNWRTIFLMLNVQSEAVAMPLMMPQPDQALSDTQSWDPHPHQLREHKYWQNPTISIRPVFLLLSAIRPICASWVWKYGIGFRKHIHCFQINHPQQINLAESYRLAEAICSLEKCLICLCQQVEIKPEGPWWWTAWVMQIILTKQNSVMCRH